MPETARLEGFRFNGSGVPWRDWLSYRRTQG